MSRILIDPVPDFLHRSSNEQRLRRQGDEPHAAAAEGVVLSSDWRVQADEREVPVYAVPVTRGGPHSFAQWDYADDRFEPVRLCLQPQGREVHSVEVTPKSLGIIVAVTKDGIVFEVDHPCHVTVMVNGDIAQPLTVSINPPEASRPDKTDPDVLYFERGLHTLHYQDFSDHGVMYLESGAVVVALPPPEDESAVNECDWAKQKNYRTCLLAKGKTNITIRGRGFLDFSLLPWHARNPIVISDCRHVTVEGVTLINAPAWNLNINRCEDVTVRNIKIYGYRENSDGIDIVSSQSVHVSDCFLRTGDDAVVVKAMTPPPVCGGKDILVERCTVWNDKVRCFGIAAETRNDITDVTFRNCDVIRSYADWTLELGALVVYICDRGTISRVTFEDIRIEHEVKFATNVMITKDFWSQDEQVGHIRDIVFKNIRVDSVVPSHVAGYDESHPVSGVTYAQVSLAGKVAECPDDLGLEIGPYVEAIRVLSTGD